MKKSFSGLLVAALAVVGVLGTSSKANAALVIDFDNPILDGGTVTASGGGNFIGSNILFGSIQLRDVDEFGVSTTLSGLQCGSATTTGDATSAGACQLNFNTGTNTLTMVAGDEGLYDIGGDFLPFTADRGDLVVSAGANLVTGSFTSFVGGPNGFLGFGIDTKNPDLLAFFGLPADTLLAFVNTEITTANGAVINADFSNVAAAPVPEPATMMLLGTGLLAAFRARRKSV